MSTPSDKEINDYCKQRRNDSGPVLPSNTPYYHNNNIDCYAKSVILGIATAFPITMYMSKWTKTENPIEIKFSGSYRLQDYRYTRQNFSNGNFTPMHFDFGNSEFLSGMFEVREVKIVSENVFAVLEAHVIKVGELPGGI